MFFQNKSCSSFMCDGILVTLQVNSSKPNEFSRRRDNVHGKRWTYEQAHCYLVVGTVSSVCRHKGAIFNVLTAIFICIHISGYCTLIRIYF